MKRTCYTLLLPMGASEEIPPFSSQVRAYHHIAHIVISSSKRCKSPYFTYKCNAHKLFNEIYSQAWQTQQKSKERVSFHILR